MLRRITVFVKTVLCVYMCLCRLFCPRCSIYICNCICILRWDRGQLGQILKIKPADNGLVQKNTVGTVGTDYRRITILLWDSLKTSISLC